MLQSPWVFECLRAVAARTTPKLRQTGRLKAGREWRVGRLQAVRAHAPGKDYASDPRIKDLAGPGPGTSKLLNR